MTTLLADRSDVVPSTIARLRMHGIKPLCPTSVTSYMESEAAKYPPSRTWRACNYIGMNKIEWTLVTGLFLGGPAGIVALLWAAIAGFFDLPAPLEALFIALGAGTVSYGSYRALAFFEITGLRGPAEWKLVPHYRIRRDELPFFVRDKMNAVRQALGHQIEFQILELVQRREKLDPILQVVTENDEISLLVWDKDDKQICIN
jgi:hypothetical protein